MKIRQISVLLIILSVLAMLTACAVNKYTVEPYSSELEKQEITQTPDLISQIESIANGTSGNGDTAGPDEPLTLPNGDPDPDAEPDITAPVETPAEQTAGNSSAQSASSAGTPAGTSAGTSAPSADNTEITAPPTPASGQSTVSAVRNTLAGNTDHTGETRSILTGEWLSTDIADSRPWSIIFNNLKIASPQSGLGDAAIVYEALAEGGITRLMGIFEGITKDSACAERLGSCRSARHYFVSVADEYDSIIISFGGTTYAEKYISKLGIDYLTGTRSYGVQAFYRDDTIQAPHNAFASLDLITKCIKRAGYRLQHDQGYTNCHYTISEEPAANPRSARRAFGLSLSYSSYICPEFKYDADTGLYTRYQFGEVHRDYNTGEPLTFSNLIVQIVHEYNKDDNGYQEIDLSDASGTGYYLTMGSWEPITWKKNEKNKTCSYYDSQGKLLTVNPGKTFISIFPDYRADKINIQ